MTSSEQAEAAPVLLIALNKARVRTAPVTLRDLNRNTVGAVIVSSDSPAPDRQRGARLLLLAVGLITAILASLAIWVFHGQIGVDPVAAARVAMILAIGALAVFLLGLYRVLITGGERVTDLRALFEDGAPSYAEYRKVSAERSRLSMVLLILLHMGWIMPLTGALIAILGQTGTLRVTGLATGTSLGALTVFIRSTALPVHRETEKRLKELLEDFRPEPKKARKAR